MCLLGVALGACSSPYAEIEGSSPPAQVSVSDGFVSGLFPTGSQPLHTPYVVGGQIPITVDALSGQDLTGWTLSSSDDSILAVTSSLQPGQAGQRVATLSAVAAGDASLFVRDSTGATIATELVSVGAPDHAAVYAPIELLSGLPSTQAAVTDADVLVGGKATFLVEYFLGNTRLFGAGALSATATNGIEATATSPSTSPVDDYLYVSPSAEGTGGSVSLSVGGRAVGSLAVDAVDPAAIAGVAIDPFVLGSLGVLYAHAKDASGGDIYGATFNWKTTGQNTDGKTNDPPGDPSDLYCYSLPSSTSSGMLHITASNGAFSTETTVSGEPSLFTSTALIPTYDSPSSCSVSAPGVGGRAGGIFGVGVGLAFLGARRRRRR
jgi:hypothetical protein